MSSNKVDHYLEVGCGRCPLGGTPDCKVHTWTSELRRLRAILQDCGLTEELKWSQPCYTFQNGNVLLLTAFKSYVAVAFFKGSLLRDDRGALTAPGENSQAVRQFRFTSVGEIDKHEDQIRAYVSEAIALAKAGAKVQFKQKHQMEYPAELQALFDEDPTFHAAFEALTPGRQRGYLLHFGSAKQAATRVSRIKKCIPGIFEGRGFNDR